MKASKKYIISICEFLENYYGVIYDGNYKLTHDELSYYLREKKALPVKRSSFKSAKDEELLNGNIILVKDEIGKVIPYCNPHRFDRFNVEDMVDVSNSSLNFIDYGDDLKNIGKYDYYFHKQKKNKVLSKKKRVLRRKYD